MSTQLSNSDINLVKAVHDAYSAKAREGSGTEYSSNVARAFGYTLDQLTSIPDESHLGLSCGNPVAAASIKPGERILDLGSGGGVDVLLAAAKVGLKGRAIGLDMSTDMISLARKNAMKQSLKPPQVAFVHAMLTEPLPIAADSIDCILSNCVVNLLPLPGKSALFKETYRVLRPGGRMVLDDIVAKKPMPEHILNNLAAYVGCISGAIQIDEYRKLLIDAGFKDIVFVDTSGDLNVYFQSKSSSGEKTSTTCYSPAGKESPQLNQTAATDAKGPSCCAPARNEGPQLNRTATSTDTKEPSCCVPSNVRPVQEKPVSSCCAPSAVGGGGCLSVIPAEFNANEWAASYQIYAIKPIPAQGDPTQPLPEPLLRWWDAYPKPRSEVAQISPEEVAALLRSPAADSSAVIDVRRDDFIGGHVRGCFQHPAQTFYDELPVFYAEFHNKGKLIFYCQSSKGRAMRCAEWYQDFLEEKTLDVKTEKQEVLVMEGGIKAFKVVFALEKDLIEGDDN